MEQRKMWRPDAGQARVVTRVVSGREHIQPA
jgi:hypothetical protein